MHYLYYVVFNEYLNTLLMYKKVYNLTTMIVVYGIMKFMLIKTNCVPVFIFI